MFNLAVDWELIDDVVDGGYLQGGDIIFNVFGFQNIEVIGVLIGRSSFIELVFII